MKTKSLALVAVLLLTLVGCEKVEPYDPSRDTCRGKLGVYAAIQGAKGWTATWRYRDGSVLFYPENMSDGFATLVSCAAVHPVLPGGVE